MDISEIKVVDDSVPMVLQHPATGEDLRDDQGRPMTIYLVGQDSKEMRGIRSELYSQNRKARTDTFDRAEARSMRILVGCTKRFENLQMGGAEIEYSDEAAEKLYRDFPWIRDQVDLFIGERANFLAK